MVWTGKAFTDIQGGRAMDSLLRVYDRFLRDDALYVFVATRREYDWSLGSVIQLPN